MVIIMFIFHTLTHQLNRLYHNLLNIKISKFVIDKISKKFKLLLIKYAINFYYYFYKNIYYEIDYGTFIHLKNISDYIRNKNINIRTFSNGFDIESKRIIEDFVKKACYISNHRILQKKMVFSLESVKKRIKVYNEIKLMKKKLKLPIDKFYPSVFYNLCGLYSLPKDILLYLNGRDFIDGGAYVGDSSLVFEKFFSPRRVYAFEPDIANYRLMLRTIKYNNLEKIIPINKALDKKCTVLKMQFSGSTSHVSKEGPKDILTESVDDLVLKESLNVGLIKLDVEGHAKKVIEGSRKTIKSQKPILIIDIYHNGEEFFEIVDYLKNLSSNYEYIIRRFDPLDPLHEITLIAIPSLKN